MCGFFNETMLGADDMKKILFLAAFLWALPSLAQTSKTGRIEVGTLANQPSNCSPGDQYTANDQTPPQVYICGPTNTWNLQGSIGSSGGIINSIATATGPSSSIFRVIGLPLGNGNADVTSCPPYVVQADGGSPIATIDRGTVLEINSSTACSVTLPAPASTGMGNYFAFKISNIGPGTVIITATSATFTGTDGGTSYIGVPNISLNTGQSVVINSDNANWHFDKHITSQLTPAPQKNVNPISVTSYPVVNSDNTWVDKFIAGSAVTVTLPKANSVTSAPFVAQRFANAIGPCTPTCTTGSFSQSAGDTLHVTIGWLNTTTITGPPTDLAGDTFTRIQPDIYNAANSFGSNTSVWQAINVAASASNSISVPVSASSTLNIGVLEYTGITPDHSSECSAVVNVNCGFTLNISNVNELAVMADRSSQSSCPAGWTSRAGLANGFQVCDIILNSTSSVLFQAYGGSFNDTSIIGADYGISGVASFTAGWEFYVENATSPCSTVTVNPTTSKINTAQQSNLTTYVVPCGMTSRFRSDGTNYEMFQADYSSIVAGALFANIPACASAMEGRILPVTDSTTAVWGVTITGGGSNHVQAYCDGTNWTVGAK
jgi:hypothetical protein